MIKKDRVKKKKRRIMLKIFVGVVLFLGFSFLVAWKGFTVKSLEVEGNTHYTDKQIESFVLSDKYAFNSLYCLFKYKFLATEEIPFIDTMEISLKTPHTLNVQVYEKGIIGYLYISSIGQNAYFDKDGFVVETSKKIINDIPLINGLSCDTVVLYEKLELKKASVLRILLTVTQTLKKYDILPTSIEFSENEELSLQYDTVKVVLGKEDYLTEKILRVSLILPQLEGMTGVLHVENWTENTTDIIFDKSET